MDDRRNTIGKQDPEAIRALAAAIYGEARNQDTIGKTAVAYTALTRAQMADVPVSDVVYGSASKNYGQYSFANPKDPNSKTVARAPRKDPDGWADAVNIAKGVLSGELKNPVPGATNYKTKAVHPGWADVYDKVGTLGDHEFYAGPEAEVRHVVQKSAASPYRREDLTPDANIGGGLGLPSGTYEDLPDIDGKPTTISTGEFDFAGKGVERGFGRMQPEAQRAASEMARTLPDDQRMTMTATHGQHGLSNLTHTPGAAFDVRTRDKTPAQLDAMIDSTLYSQPAAIGYNSGAGRFPAHMHVDTNAGYGTGLQSTSDLTGLSDYAKQELARYDADMKSGLGYVPPVPESIAPVPEARPTIQDAIARNPYEGMPAVTETAGLSGGVSSHIDAANPNFTSDGVPINRVQSVSIRPDQGLPQAEPSALASISSVGSAFAGTPAKINNAITVEPTDFNPSATSSIGFSPSAKASTSFSLDPVEVASIGSIGFTPGAIGNASIALQPEDQPTTLPDLPSKEIGSLPEVADVGFSPVSTPERSRTFSAPEPAAKPAANATEVWGGSAAEGVATDGSKISRNPDGSISRFSSLSGKTEKISDSVDDWQGPSIGDTSAKTGGFWSNAASSLPGSGQRYQGGQQIRTEASISDRINDVMSSIKDGIQNTLGNSKDKQRSGRSGLSSYGQHAYDNSQQVRDAVDSGSSGLW